MHGWGYLLIMGIVMMGCGASALVDQTIAPSSAILDQKEFQRAAAEPGDVVYARAEEEQKALREAAEAHVQGLRQMTFKEIRAAVTASGDGADAGVLTEPIPVSGADPVDLQASETRLRLLHGFLYAILGVLAVWVIYWGVRKAAPPGA